MKHVNFYDEHRKTDSFAKAEIRQNDTGGADILVNGMMIPDVIDYKIIPNHPFPRLIVEIAIEELFFDSGVSPNGLHDCNDNGHGSNESKRNICPGFPWNWLPAKIKSRFGESKPVR